MKRFRLLALALVSMLLLAATVVHADTGTSQAPQRTLDVIGRGVVAVKYDTAVIRLGVSELKDTAGQAYTTMSVNMNAVVLALKELGITDEQMKTGTLNLDAVYDWKDGTQTLKGYRATNSIEIRTQQMEKVADVIQAAIKAGANQLYGVSFTVKDPDKLMEQALDSAVDDAKAKAERVAKRLGAQVGSVVRVTIHDNGGSIPMPMARAGMEMKSAAAYDMAAPVMSGGTYEYSVSVSATFELR